MLPNWEEGLWLACLVALLAVPVAGAVEPPPPPPAPPPAAVEPAAAPTLANALARQVAELRGQVRAQLKPEMTAAVSGALPRASGSLVETYLALAAVQVEEARDYLNMTPADLDSAAASLKAAQDLLQVREPKTPPALVRHGKLIEHAYFSPNDESPQPYFVYVPTSYSPDKPSPLVVFLHGYVPTTCRTDPYLVSDFVIDLAEKYGTLFVIPHGRTNTDFQAAGEVDVLRVKAEMEKFYRVAPDRVYLLGISMGGAGAWQVATHYPDLWAAVAPINGQADWFRFWNRNFNYPPRAELPPHMRYLIALNNPLDLARNLSCLYSYSQHATLCFVGVEHTRLMVARLKELGAPYETFEDPSELGHFIYWRPECWARAFEHFVKQTRSPEPPKVIRYATYSLRYPGAYWFQIARFGRWGTEAVVEATAVAQGGIRISSENVDELLLTPPAAWAAGDATFTVTWNQATLPPRKPDAAGQLRLARPDASPRKTARLRKSAAVCGPAADVFNFPFVLVRGTLGTEAETAALSKLAAQFAADWNAYAEGRVAILRDVDVTAALMRAKGLVLFGLPETNAVVGRLAAELPFKLSRAETVLPDGRRFPTAGTGLILTYPNPLAPERYVLICNGLHWGVGRSANHKFDRLPDFTIFTAEPFPEIGSNQFLAAGLFDADWQYDPALTDFAPLDKPPTRPTAPNAEVPVAPGEEAGAPDTNAAKRE